MRAPKALCHRAWAVARARVQLLTRVSPPLPAVHAALLDDLVFPTQIEARRTRYRTDGSKLLKVYLDPKGAYHAAAHVATLWRSVRRPGAFCALAVHLMSPPPNADRNTVELKLDTFSGVYTKLTGKACVFEFKESA